MIPVVACICGLVYLLLYFNFGLKEFIEANKNIENLSRDIRGSARREFYTLDIKGKYRQYGGTIAYINRNKQGGIAIWGKEGLRYFVGEKGTTYSYFRFCTDENLEVANLGGPFHIKRDIYEDISLWSKEVMIGDYIAIEIKDSKSGFDIIREAKSNDFNSYLPFKPHLVCIGK